MQLETEISQNSTQFADTIKNRAVSGMAIFSFRRFLIQLLQSGANILLARLLFPADFGVSTVVFTVMSIFSLVSDLGLQGALIQAATTPTTKELRGMFFIHVLLGSVATCILWLTAPLFISLYPALFTARGVFYLRLTSMSILLYNLRLIPAALLERELAFRKLVSGEIIEIFITQAVTVYLAIQGWGVSSFFWGLVAGRLSGLMIFYMFRPWPVGISLEIHRLKSLLKFGVSFQAHMIIGVVGGAAAPVIVGTIAGPAALGFVVWAGGITATALIVSEVVSRVIFAVGSRIQTQPTLVSGAIERGVLFTNVLALPINLLMMALAEPLTRIIYTEKWLAGLPLFYIFSLATTLSIFSSVLQNALLALGHSRVVRNISFLRMSALWILATLLVVKWGVVGFAWASVVVSGTSIILWHVLKKRVRFRIWTHTMPYFLLAGISSLVVFAITKVVVVQSVLMLGLVGILGMILYVGLVRVFAYAPVKENLEVIRKVLL